MLKNNKDGNYIKNKKDFIKKNKILSAIQMILSRQIKKLKKLIKK